MKKFLCGLALVISSSAFADHHRHYDRGPDPAYWVAPLVVGAIGAAIISSQMEPRYVPPPVYQVPQPSYYQPQPTYAEVQEWDRRCACYVRVWRQVGWQ